MSDSSLRTFNHFPPEFGRNRVSTLLHHARSGTEFRLHDPREAPLLTLSERQVEFRPFGTIFF